MMQHNPIVRRLGQPDQASSRQDTGKQEVDFDRLGSVRTANQRLEDARHQPEIKQLAGVIWQRYETHVLFADAGLGKSIHGITLADYVARGKSIAFLEQAGQDYPKEVLLPNENEPLKTMYYDWELSDKQFEKRYRDNIRNKGHTFSENLFMDTVDFFELSELDPRSSIDDLIFAKIEHDISSRGIQVIVVDNITFLHTQTTQKTEAALELMRRLVRLKRKYNVSMLILAHTPKRDNSRPLSLNDLAGSKHISNFIDSASAIGRSVMGSDVRYWKQIKPSRSGEERFGEDHVISMRLHKREDCFLTFEYLGCDYELNHLEKPKGKDEQREMARNLKEQGKSLREIEEELGVPKSTLGRWLKD